MNDQSSKPLPTTEADCAVRCGCGCLLARLVPGGVELKCRRCKATHVIALTTDASWDAP